MADDPKSPFAEDPMARPLFGPSREATPAEMALVDGPGDPPGDDEDHPDGDEGGEEEVQAPQAAADGATPSPEAGPPPAPAPQAPGPASDGGAGGGADVINLRKPVVEDLVQDFPALVLKTFTERNAKTTGESYAGHLKRFLTWCAARGVNIPAMPPDTAMTYLTEAYPNPVTRNQGIVALRAAFDIGNINHVPFGPQELVKTIRPAGRQPAKPAAAAAPAPRGNGSVAPRGPSLGATAADIIARENIATATPTETVSTVRATPTSASPKKGTSAVPSLGGRVRVSKRVDGTEGLPGVPVGALVLIGDYAGHDLDGEGRIESFIANYIRPQYGPFAGARPCVYYVDRLDNLGNPIPGSTLNVPIMPSPASESNPGMTTRPAPQVITGNGAVALGAQVPTPPAATGITGDRFLDFILSEQKRREDEANKRIEELKKATEAKGMDPAVLMLLVDRVKPEPLDPTRIIAEAKRQGFLKPPAPAEPPPGPLFPGQGHPGGMGGGGPGGPFNGMDPFALPEPRPDPGIEALTAVLKQQGDMLTALLTRAMTPAPPQQQMGIADVIALAKSLAPTPAPESALSGQVMSALITRALAPPEKPKSIAETLKEIAALNEAKELLGGTPEDKPISFGEVVAAAIENAPAIGQAVATVLSSMPRAPTLSQPGAPQRRATDPQPVQAAPPARTPSAPLPKEAQTAFLALKTAEGAQDIVNHIFSILTSYVQAGAEPWPRVANRLVDDFKKCDTRAEIRTVATNLFVWAGAKRHMTDEIIERITVVLYDHYAEILTQIAPGSPPKTLKADEPAPAAQAEAAAADAAAAEGQAPTYEDTAPADTIGNAQIQ